MFCYRLQPVASWVHQHSQTASDRLAAAWHRKRCKRMDRGQGCWVPQIQRDKIYWRFLFISTHISLVLIFAGSPETDIVWGGNLNGHSVARCSEILVPKTIKIYLSSFKLQSIMSGMFLTFFVQIWTPILRAPISPYSAEADIGWGGNVNSRLMASCVRNIRTKNY